MKEKKDVNVEIGGRIQEARKAAGLTQDKFAELIDMGTKNVSAIERGAVGVSLSAMKRICKVLAVSSDSLLFGPSPSNSDKDLLLRLERLTPQQYEIANGIFNKLLEAFAVSEH